MATLVADFILERLTQWGIHRLYGYPGDGINGFLGALDRAEGDPEFIQVRHEEMAAFMACGHAKYTGEVGVCLATSGPGAIHLLNGLYDAKLDHAPVVAIVGQQKRMSLGGEYQQEVDLNTLFKDVSAYVQVCMEPAQARHLVDRAVRIAQAERTVCTLIIPNDVQEEKAIPSPPREHGAIYSGPGYVPPRVVPRDEVLDNAAEILNAGEKVAMLVGRGALGAEDKLVETAEVLGAGVAKALLGRAVLPDDLSFVTGSIGLLGTRPSYELMSGCDTLLVVGSSFPYSEWLPKEGQARGVQIDLDPKLIGIRYPMEALLVGDAKETLEELLPRLERKEDRSWREEIEGWVEDWWRLMDDWAMQDGDPINPQRVVWELSKQLPDGAILAADSGSSTNWFARDLRLRKGMQASLSGTLATMGDAVPYAIAAKFAYPERPVIALLGDGSFQMNGMNELLTVAKYRERWSDQRLVFCVFNNQDLNQVTWEQRVLAGDPMYPATQRIPDFPAARYADLVGLHGVKVERPEDLADAWSEVLSAGRPAVLEAIVDPEIPPLPPHITGEQMKKMAKAMVKGDPEAVGVMEKSLRAKIEEFLPGR
jgi:pyruvate dehydrogenase (quinone)